MQSFWGKTCLADLHTTPIKLPETGLPGDFRLNILGQQFY